MGGGTDLTTDEPSTTGKDNNSSESDTIIEGSSETKQEQKDESLSDNSQSGEDDIFVPEGQGQEPSSGSDKDPTGATDPTNEPTDDSTDPTDEPADPAEPAEPVAPDAEDIVPGTDKELDKSKMATELDENDESSVTLSIPSESQTLSADIVFVLDKSSCNNAGSTTEKFRGLISELKAAQEQTGSSIKIGIVVFNWQANKALDLTDISKKSVEDLVALADGFSGGTNMDAGLSVALDMLKSDKDVEDSRKHLVLIGDGLTWLWQDDATGYPATNTALNFQGHTVYGTSTWTSMRREMKVKGYPVPPCWSKWDDYWAWIRAHAASSDINNAQFDILMGSQDDYGDGVYMDRGTPIPYKAMTEEDPGSPYLANMERAMYEAWETYTELSDNYKCYAFNAIESSTSIGDHFMKMLNGGAVLDFNKIQDKILYAVGAGSRVEDYMGYEKDKYNFDFVDDASSITLKVGKEEYEAVKIEDAGNATSAYGFKSVEGKYMHVVEYFAGDKQAEEHFVWTMNENVSNFEPVALTYKVKLSSKSLEAGNHTIYTNQSATLYPISSEGERGTPEDFERPKMTYTIAEKIVRYHTNYPEDVTLDAGQADELYTEEYTIASLERVEFETPDGYTFKGWNTEAGGKGDPYKADDPFTLAVDEEENASEDQFADQSVVSTSSRMVASARGMNQTSSSSDVPQEIVLELYAQWEAPADEPNSTPSPVRPNRPSSQTEEPAAVEPVLEEPTEIEEGETPMAGPTTGEPGDAGEGYEEEDIIDDGDTPLAGLEEEEVAEEAIPHTPFTGDERHTVVWTCVSLAALVGIVLLSRRRKEEE